MKVLYCLKVMLYQPIRKKINSYNSQLKQTTFKTTRKYNIHIFQVQDKTNQSIVLSCLINVMSYQPIRKK